MLRRQTLLQLALPAASAAVFAALAILLVPSGPLSPERHSGSSFAYSAAAAPREQAAEEPAPAPETLRQVPSAPRELPVTPELPSEPSRPEDAAPEASPSVSPLPSSTDESPPPTLPTARPIALVPDSAPVPTASAGDDEPAPVASGDRLWGDAPESERNPGEVPPIEPE